MRIRIAASALAGAVALGALVAPTASADTALAPTIDKASAAPVVVGVSLAKTQRVSVTVSDDSGIQAVHAAAWPNVLQTKYGEVPTASDAANIPAATCTAQSTTTSVCVFDDTIDPADLYNEDAGTWNVAVLVDAKDGGTAYNAKAATTSVRRYAKLTANASPEPVSYGGTLTVTGKLSRANWDDGYYHGYANQPVKLQFRKAGTSTYTTVKTVYTDSYGRLKTTTRAYYSGYWRFTFAGSTTTGSARAVGDGVVIG